MSRSTYCDGCGEPRILPENAQSVDLFNAVLTQRLYKPNGRLMGLNHTAVESAARMMKVDDTADAFYCLRTMENELLEIAAEQEPRDGDAD